MIRSRGTLAWLLGAALLIGAVAVARVGTANMIQNRPINQTVFDNAGQPWPFFSQVAAINYDKGGQGLGYNVPSPDTADCPAGSTYRPDAVNLKTSTAGAPAIPFQIGCSFGPNSYNYTINISQSGPYQITLQLADDSAGGSWNILIDGVVVANVPTPNTGSFNTFATSTSGSFTASLGTHKMTIGWATGDANFAGAGDFLTWQGSKAATTTINSVSMTPCGNVCTFVGGTAGSLGTAVASMSSGTFAGSWSLRTSGTDNFNTTCNNYGAGFTINSSSGAVSNGAIASGSYPGVCLLATQAGAGGSPFAQAVTFTGTTTPVPTPAQVAGYTTLVIDYDFTQPSPWSNTANWLRCHDGSGAATPILYQDWSGFGGAKMPPCSNIAQRTDPLGSPALNLHMDLTALNAMGCLPDCSNQVTGMPVETVDSAGNGNRIPVDAYVEVTGLISTSDPSMTHLFSDFWSYAVAPDTAIEWDGIEWFGNNIGFSTYHNNENGQVVSTNEFDNLDTSAYHKYAWRVTNDGVTGGFFCSYKDDAPAASSPGNCISWQPTADQLAHQTSGTVQMQSGYAGCGMNNFTCPNSSIDIWVRRLRVWSCAGINSGARCLTSSPNP